MRSPLLDEALRDGHPAAEAEGATRHFQAGHRLRAFVFVEIDAALDPADGLLVPPARDDLGNAELLLDVEFENRIEDFVRGERVLVALIRLQFSARR